MVTPTPTPFVKIAIPNFSDMIVGSLKHAAVEALDKAPYVHEWWFRYVAIAVITLFIIGIFTWFWIHFIR
jgi:hypothetical protein